MEKIRRHGFLLIVNNTFKGTEVAAWEVFNLFQIQCVIPYPKAQYSWTGQLRAARGGSAVPIIAFLSEAGG